MTSFLRCIHSGFYKLRHTSMIWIHIFIPLVIAALFSVYYCVSPWKVDAKMSGYFEAVGIGFPIIIGLVCGKAAEQENEAGCFQNMMCCIKSRATAYAGKLTVLLLLSAFAVALAAGVFSAGFKAAPFSVYMNAGALLFTGSLFIYILHLFISVKFGRGASIGLGIFESLISALSITGLGDGVWYYIPCTWSVRLCDSFIYGWFYHAEAVGYAEICKCFTILVPSVIGAFALSLLWFRRFEGRKTSG